MKTTESNKLIAEFMGYIPNLDGYFTLEHNVLSYIAGNYYMGLELGTFKPEDLKYHSSWDWIIPTIDKITDLPEYQEYKDLTIDIVSEGGIYINTKYIENTYNDVVEFIMWYNTTQKTAN